MKVRPSAPRRAAATRALAACLVASVGAFADDGAYRSAPAADAEGAADDAPMTRTLGAISGDPAPLREALDLEAAGRGAEAIGRIEAAIRETPEVPRLWEVLGLLHWKSGRPAEALAVWTRFAVADGARPEPHIWIGELHAARNELRPALEAFDRALKLAPGDMNALFQRTRVYRWLGHIEEAAATTRGLCAREPDRADFRRELAAALFANREYAEAAALWARVRRDRPTDSDAEIREIASRAYATGDDAAVRDAVAYLERFPGHVLALRTLSDLAQSSGRREEALDYLKRLLKVETDPKKKARLAFRCADLLSGLHESHPDRFTIQEAVDLVQGYLTVHPYDVDVRLLLGELFIEAQDWTRARDAFEVTLREYNPQNIRATRGLFEICVASGRHREAGKWLDRVRAFNPADPYLAYLEARMDAANGDYGAALEALDRLEISGARGAVAVLLYHGLSESDWTDIPSVRIVREQIDALKAAGYRFVSAHDLPATLNERNAPEQLSHQAPLKIACVTWDDARRDAMRYGTPLGRSLGIPMTMHIPVGYVKEDHPFIAGWNGLRACTTAGTWHFSSHAYDGHDPRPALRGGGAVHPLANRLWLDDAGRQETETEYRARLLREYRGSREAIVAELKRPREADVFAYPFGDIGQLSHSNVTNAPELNLAVARKYYKVGFTQSHFGHAVYGDDPLLYQRTEPFRAESGPNLVARILGLHPVFLARATRVEIAVLADKPYLANEMLDLLARDGYPAERLAPLQDKVRRAFGGSMFRWPFRRKTSPAVETSAPPVSAAMPAGTAEAVPDPTPGPAAPKTDNRQLPPRHRPNPLPDAGPAPGEELRREAGRNY
ncbi:MAG: tetratricopeptide repeat protein [Verrucomicrobia bacterium]|nr:tetratricopeptide repeat protein [Verrucomicrobiota bacterium]